MATGGTSGSTFESHGRRLVNIHDTLCNNVNVEKVSSLLQCRKDVSKQAKKNSRKAAKLKDPEVFYSVLGKFDFKSFVAFVDIVQEISENDDKHLQLLYVICSNYKELSEFSDSENQESHSKLKAIIKHCEGEQVEIRYRKGDDDGTYSEGMTDVTSGLASTTTNIKSKDPPIDLQSIRNDLWTIQHPVEEEALEYSHGEGVFYSHTHGVRVIADRQSLPDESLHIILTVNDYSSHVVIPEDYNACYSALISLKCYPKVDAFLDFVSVTIPHCAHGDVESLRVLSASESEDKNETLYLREDSDIEIDSIDEYYFTFRTKHFSKYRVAGVKNSHKLKQRKKNPKGTHSLLSAKRKSRSFERSTSGDATESGVVETIESGVGNTTVINARFVAIRCIPDHQVESPLKCYFFVTYDIADTYAEEVAQLAMKKWHNSFKWEKSQPFVFNNPLITFEPKDENKDGWNLRCTSPPPSLIKTDIMEYFERANRSLPCIPYSMYTNDKPPKQTYFSITLQGSWIPVLKSEASMEFVCALHTSSMKINARAIVIISEMYENKSPLIEAIRGANPDYQLTMESYECSVFLCEISFHLPHWEKVATAFDIDQEETSRLKSTYDSKYFYEAAYNMLMLWLERSDHPPTFQTLLSVLHRCNLDLDEGTWKKCFDISHLEHFHEHKFLQLSRNIISFWKFVARLLGMKEHEIEEIEIDHEREKVWERALQMLLKWKTSSQIQCDYELNVRLFNALQCIRDHTGKLSDSLTYLLTDISL